MDLRHRLFDHARRISLALLSASLAACTSMSGLSGSSEFQCKAPEGIPCQSISGVHFNEAAGNLPAQRAGRTASAAVSQEAQREAGSADSRSSEPASKQVAVRPLAASNRDAEAMGPPGAIRSDPTVIRIWVAPWEDADGDLNDQSYVYLQIDSGRWLIEHNRAQIRREFAPQRPVSVTVSAVPGTAPAARAGEPGAQPVRPNMTRDEAVAAGRAMAQGGSAAPASAGAKATEVRP